MDEIEKRLRESTDACIKSFENWVKQSKSLESREELMETMHDVRKVISRVEIEIAISERDRLGSRPIPIPPHRSSRKRPGEVEDGGSEGHDDYGMDANDQQPQSNANDQQRRPQHQHGRNRRPMPNRGGGGGGNNGNNSDNQQQ